MILLQLNWSKTNPSPRDKFETNRTDRKGSVMSEPKPIPLSALSPLTTTLWRSDDFSLGKFAQHLASHESADREAGVTCRYDLDVFTCSLTPDEVRAMIADDVIDPVFHADDGQSVNQHWLHSMDQFYAEVTKAWRNHLDRTNAIIGTPAGRIHRA